MSIVDISKSEINNNGSRYIEFSLKIKDDKSNNVLIKIIASKLVAIPNSCGLKYTPSRDFETKLLFRADNDSRFVFAKNIDKKNSVKNLFNTTSAKVLLSADDLNRRLTESERSITRFFVGELKDELGNNVDGPLKEYIDNLLNPRVDSDYSIFLKKALELKDNMRSDESKILLEDIIEEFYNVDQFNNTTKKNVYRINDIFLPSIDSYDEANNIIVSIYNYELDTIGLALTPKKKLNVSIPKGIEEILRENNFYLIRGNNYKRDNEDQLTLF